MDAETYVKLLGWYNREARLLDTRQFNSWLDLLAPEIRYTIPLRYHKSPDTIRDFATWDVNQELSTEEELGIMEDNFDSLSSRVKRLGSGMAWSETPPSFTRRVVSNLEYLETPEGYSVTSAFILVKNRFDDSNWLSGCRNDVLLDVDEDLRLVKRQIILDEGILSAPNLSSII